ncbi:septal ring lytic transglycosylase RlpA family protein [Paraburkholderia sp. GAS41]|jgi:rare lipoprotein A|uniref:septal ring lytic transglycosylase RlpA family protein n=1 Tax=Paraburkholderia sp. GAS41 TaxID=3035134 RepID=UPI003D2050B9
MQPPGITAQVDQDALPKAKRKAITTTRPPATEDSLVSSRPQEPARPETGTAPSQDLNDDTSSFWQSGVASWYSNRFQGRRTASGERYDLHALTAAHRTLPLGSYVRVTAVSSARSVVVRINDRGPYAHGRVIDLSYAAAAALDLPRAGTLLVRIETVTRQEAGT